MKITETRIWSRDRRFIRFHGIFVDRGGRLRFGEAEPPSKVYFLLLSISLSHDRTSISSTMTISYIFFLLKTAI